MQKPYYYYFLYTLSFVTVLSREFNSISCFLIELQSIKPAIPQNEIDPLSLAYGKYNLIIWGADPQRNS